MSKPLRNTPRPRKRTPRLMRVEALEDRRVLAAFAVTHLGDGPVSAPDDLPGSLRQAIYDCNHTAGADEIVWQEGVTGTITLTEGELLITEGVTITGLGADQTTIDAGGDSRVLNIDDGDSASQFDVTLTALTITGGRTTLVGEPGAGIRSRENLTVVGSSVSDNSTAGIGSYGGGIYSNPGDLTLIGSTVSGNSTEEPSSDGGGIFQFDGTLTVTESTISNNSTLRSDSDGGGMFIVGNLTLLNSTVSGNSTLGSDSEGGGIHGLGTLYVSESTISDNVTNGYSSQGGGIFVVGNLTVTGSTISDNSTLGSRSGGGAIDVEGDFTVSNTTLSGNIATGNGGGIVARSGNGSVTSSSISGGYAGVFGGGIVIGGAGHLAVTDSTFSANTAARWGGGLIFFIGSESTSSINNSTISGNVAVGGGGIANGGADLTVQHSTITDNYAREGYGSGIFSDGEFASTEIGSSIISGNVNSDADYMLYYEQPGPPFGDNTFSSAGYNLIGTGRGLPAFSNNDQTGVTNPMLGALADNGGPTLTHAVLPGSPAVDAGGSATVPPLQFDQRGAPFSRVFGGLRDVGAFELIDGDFDADEDYTCADVDALVATIAAETHDPTYDLNSDALVNQDDLDTWLAVAGVAKLPSRNPFLRGDANLDGVVDGLDFIKWNENRFTETAAWCRGDFNANGVVDGSDFIIWNGNKFQSSAGTSLAALSPQADDTEESSDSTQVPVNDEAAAVVSRPLAQPAAFTTQRIDALFAISHVDQQSTEWSKAIDVERLGNLFPVDLWIL